MTINIYRWEHIHRFFPPEIVEEYRKKIITEWESGKFTDREIWERYGMSENAFYDLIKRYSKDKEEGLKDKPSNPKKPFRKLDQNNVESIINKAVEEEERIKAHQSQFESDMRKDGRSLSRKKLERLKKQMDRAILGTRRISHWFNSEMKAIGKKISIGKSRVYGILAAAKIYKEKKKIEKKHNHLKRPEEPLVSLSMDFTQKWIGNGLKKEIFGLLDMYNDAFVMLTGHPEKNGDIVADNLKILREMIPEDQQIEIRSDAGTEFDNKTVKTFCNANKIHLHILPKASPWLQAFIERAFRTLHEEFLNLVWIGNEDKLGYVLNNTKYGYNNRPNSAFNYQSPLDIMSVKKSILPQQVYGH